MNVLGLLLVVGILGNGWLVNAFRADLLLATQIVHQEKKFSEAAVVTNSEICTNIGLFFYYYSEILSEEGSAADAAIGALLCEGVTNPQSMGVGGGFLLTFYNGATKNVEVLNARESAPKAASKDMFGGPASGDGDIGTGALSVAVPGELMGYWALHQRYGKMSWYDIFKPTIDLCEHGVTVTHYTARMIGHLRDEILASATIKDLMTNPQTGDLYKEGDLMLRPALAETLEMVAKHGPSVLYHGNLTEDFIYDIRDNGGIITVEDMKHYSASWLTPVSGVIGDFKVFSAPSPGSGRLLLTILEVMSKKLSCKDDLFWHRLVECWKFAFGLRSSMTGPCIGDKATNDSKQHDGAVVRDIIKKMKDCSIYPSPKDYFEHGKPAAPDHGTSHLAVLAPNGDAVSVTSTINLSFGSMFASESTGIILNNEMIDFSIPHHYDFKSSKGDGNLIAPNRQPMSSMLPTIVLDKNRDLRLVIGSSGGFKIITSTSAVILQHLFMGVGLEEAVHNRRLHHQLRPMLVEYEEGFHDEVLHSLMSKGHKLQQLDAASKPNTSSSMSMHSGVNAIAVVSGEIHAVADSRRTGVADGY
ncbi:PREDICTED: gamma-glutamyltranspeptidase 1-like [Nicrophorus vespilloides]|uniref:Gamma-glutamyltranspeptidase 1-like n=1 Tax=Nicrophorus vespilloides TaxID=110193 RepID=A0ABM1NFD9_NICVS|nr:PREDICTED: gamma-glutamyltranspeptidase 1-like [Nicrophorus vespilloides]